MINQPTTRNKKHNIFSIIIILIFIQSVVTKVAAQNSLPQLQNSVKPNPAPTAPGDIFQPVMLGAPVANAPTFAEWTKTAGADESLVVTGINFSRYTGLEEGKDTRFFLYSHNFSKDEKIQRLDGNKAMITLDSALPDWSMYLIWPGNEAGYGYPAAVNKTDAWWVGPDKAAKGSTVAVYGRNLSHNNDSLLSYIYLKSASGTGQWLNVTKVNPYKVEFLLPAGTPDGDYEVWTHNGHGGDFGWSGPLILTVFAGQQWTNTIFNVKNYGAIPDDGNDDTGPIKNAIQAASQNPYSTVYFPAGTYIFSDLLSLGDNMRWKGDGKNVSILKSVVDFVPSATNMVLSTSQNVEITDMGFDGSNINVVNNIDKPFFFRNSTDLKLKNLSFNFPT
ncbi:MAG TPA: glycosyl hydrolase family 28-related protein, partial [Flavisolibacter sp.]|nr:glycosyl hydrolase family 28-related protein [Flavisolibacter sp.]